MLGEATKKRQSKVLKKKPAQAAAEDLLLDLMGDSGPSMDSNGAANGTQQSQDLLADILGGGGPSTSSPPPQTSSPTPQSNVANIMDLFNSGPSSSPAPVQSRAPPQAASMRLGHLHSQHTTRTTSRLPSSLSATRTRYNFWRDFEIPAALASSQPSTCKRLCRRVKSCSCSQ